MSPKGRFAYSNSEMYCNDKGFIMVGGALQYLCAILNSSLITWLINNTTLTTGAGLTQWKKFAVERIPIPKIPPIRQQPFITVVDKILKEKSNNRLADTGEQEADIDLLVYNHYDLTSNEIATIETRW